MKKLSIKEYIPQWQDELEKLDASELIRFFSEQFGQDLTLASSLGAEDQVLSHLFLKINPKAKIFVLDTGRLHQETYDVMAETMKSYSMTYDVYFPDRAAVEDMVQNKGPNLFYDSVENRKNCCGTRKVEPLGRALSGKKAWITGLRKSQSVTRSDMKTIEWDEGHGLVKLNPLAEWSEERVWDFIKENNIPYNRLHDKGFPSIGCAPCTRAIEKGEDLRAGRWWWEEPENKECGLHVVDGKLVRKNK